MIPTLLAITITITGGIAPVKVHYKEYTGTHLTVETTQNWAWDYVDNAFGGHWIKNPDLCIYTFKEIEGEFKMFKPFLRACRKPGVQIRSGFLKNR